MTEVAQRVLAEALDLEPEDRALIIDGLCNSFARKAGPKVEAAWMAEVECRLVAYRAGQLPADTADAVLARMGQR